jgi:hypothetical protein
MAASNTRFTQNSLGQSKTPIDSDHGIYRDLGDVVGNYPFERSQICWSDRWQSRGSGPVAGAVRLRGGGDAGYQVDVVGNACKPVAVF